MVRSSHQIYIKSISKSELLEVKPRVSAQLGNFTVRANNAADERRHVDGVIESGCDGTFSCPRLQFIV